MSVAVEQEILTELADLRTRLPDVSGALVATVDGLLVAHETTGLQPETLAAMSAAQLGLGRQFAMASGQGVFSEAVIHAESGVLAVFAAGDRGLLTVFATAQLNLGRLYHEVRPVATRIGTILARRPTSTGAVSTNVKSTSLPTRNASPKTTSTRNRR